MAPADGAGAIAVVVVHCPSPGAVDEVEVRLPAGATLRDAVAASGVAGRHAAIDLQRAGIWGRVRPPDSVLRDGDRVELYRPLRVDPKEARRQRDQGQRRGAAASGSRSR